MNPARYFLPEHPKLTDVYSKTELRAMLQAGQLSRSDIVTDDETGIAHLLGDLLAMPFRGAAVLPARSTTSLQSPVSHSHEFRADTPLPRGERDQPAEEVEDEADADVSDSQNDEDEDTGAALTESESLPQNEPDAGTDDGEEEELLYLGHPSWFAFPKSLLVAAVCIWVAVFVQQRGVGLEWITLPGSIAGLILLFIGLDRTATTYYVTTKRVEMEFGVIGHNTKEVRIRDIRAIDVMQKGFDAFIGLGTVKFDSSVGPEVCFRNVRHPHDIKQLVRDLQG